MDSRGRIWILENSNYPNCPGEKRDRILILENDPQSGAVKQTVFYDKLSFSSGIAIGHGGVWVGTPPNLLFFPREESEDVFKDEPEIVLDGWGWQDTHETLNNFIWGPDGWLYGSHGIFTRSNVGKPGAGKADRTYIDAGLWRYHPKKEIFEVYAEGGSNQWGLDFNDHGQGYFAACVIPHSWQAIQGARYIRQAGAHTNPFVYDNIGPIADFSYEKRAYCGAMIYLGGQWPQEYRNTFFFGDIHMNTMRNERHEPNGSGSKALKNGDFLVSKDKWYRGLSPQYGPDGSVFINDWYDRVPCHQQREYTDRSNGRLYKISYGNPEPARVDLTKATSAELVAHQLHENDWFVRHARLILAERGPDKDVHTALKKMLAGNADDTRQLRALWALHVTGGVDEALLLTQLSAKSEYLRAWAIQLACEDRNPGDALLKKFSEMAATDPSAVVRRYLASAAGRLDFEKREAILLALVAHGEDADDPNLPQLVWYAAEHPVASDHAFATKLLGASEFPLVSRNIARRLSEKGHLTGIAAIVSALGDVSEDGKVADAFTGMNLALKGMKGIAPPAAWTALHQRASSSADGRLKEQAKTLAVLFGGEEVIAAMRALVTDATADEKERGDALRNLISIGDPSLKGMLIPLLQKEDPVRIIALRGLVAHPTPAHINSILGNYGRFSADEKTAALATLGSSTKGTDSLLKAVDAGIVPMTDLTAQLVRQLHASGSGPSKDWITRNWGSMRKTSAEKEEQMTEFRKFLGERQIMEADASQGRVIFNQRCAACHTLHGEGQKDRPRASRKFQGCGLPLAQPPRSEPEHRRGLPAELPGKEKRPDSSPA